jgi:hypothetical protein
MSDFNSSLPVRTETNGDVAAKIVDGTITSQALAVDAAGKITAKLDDASGNGITSQANGGQQALDVGIDVAGVQIDPRQVRALTSADVVTVDQGTSPWVTNLSQLGGSALVFGQATMANSIPVVLASNESVLPVSQSGTWTVGLSDDMNYGTVGSNTLRTAAEIGNATGAADFNFGTVGAQTLRVASEIGNATGAADFNNGVTGAQTLRVAANLAVSGANVSISNPVPVTITSAVPGLAVQDYHTSVNLAAGASVTFTYTVASGHTFSLERCWASASGKIKAELKNNGATIMVGFNSTATPNIDMTIVAPPTIAAAGTASVIITNEDKAAMDVYATLEGDQN